MQGAEIYTGNLTCQSDEVDSQRDKIFQLYHSTPSERIKMWTLQLFLLVENNGHRKAPKR